MTRFPFVTIPAIAAALAAGAARAQATGGDLDYYGHPMMWGGGYGFFGVGMMVIFWGIIILLAVLAGRWLMERGPGQGRTSAHDILKERLARGEIDAEEYRDPAQGAGGVNPGPRRPRRPAPDPAAGGGRPAVSAGPGRAPPASGRPRRRWS